MKWIGLTGGIASGKSTVSRILQAQGLAVVDADEIARRVVEPGTPGLAQVISRFGSGVLHSDGSLDRKKLGKLVFGKPEELLALENILHPLIQNETARQRESWKKKGKALAFYDVPLLFEKKLEDNFDAIVVVQSSEALQKSRMKQRDQLSDAEIDSRLKSQIPMAKKVDSATWVLRNEGSLQELEAQTLQLIKSLQSGNA